jgi:hypothetical protein
VSKMAWAIGLRQVLAVQTKRSFFTLASIDILLDFWWLPRHPSASRW